MVLLQLQIELALNPPGRTRRTSGSGVNVRAVIGTWVTVVARHENVEPIRNLLNGNLMKV